MYELLEMIDMKGVTMLKVMMWVTHLLYTPKTL